MKKWMTLLILVIMLAACGTSGTNTTSNNAQPPEDEKNSTQENAQQDTGDTNGSVEENQTSEQDSQQQESDDKSSDEKATSQPEKVEPQYQVSDIWYLKPIADANKNVVLLTIDDAPDKHALEMAKTLKKLNAPAIFFVNGHFIDTAEEQTKLKEIYDMGFTIGNHTFNHTNLGTISEEEQKQQILDLSDLIEKVIGEKPKFFRAPNGTNTDYSTKLVKEQGMQIMNWSYGYDYFKPYMDTEKIKEAMITGKGPEVGVDYSLLKPGAILLMHDRPWTAEALEDIVKGLRAQGYDFVDPKLIETP